MTDQTSSAFIGGRPYTKTDHERFFERKPECDRLAEIVSMAPVSALLAASGVGKTSMLQAGLKAQLGTQVGILRTWTAIDDEAPYASAVAQAFPELFPDGPASADPWDVLDPLLGTFGDDVVIVFDQFESLLRYSPKLATRLMVEVGTLVREDDPPVHHVFSLRSEFRQRLRPLERTTRLSTIEIEPLEPEQLKASLKGLGSMGAGGVTVTGAVTDLLTDIVDAADKDDLARNLASRSSAEVGIGALHLQVLHEAVWHAVLKHQPDVTIIGEEEAEKALASFGTAGKGEDDPREATRASDIVQAAFRRALDRALDHRLTEDADEDPTRDKLITAAIGRHLSVQGYKIPRTISELRDSVFSDEVILLEGLFGRQTAADDDSGEDLAPGSEDDDSRDHRSGWAWELDADAISAELDASFRRVVERLGRADVLRSYQPPGSPDLIVELVHDGWGRPFEAWAQDLVSWPRWNVERAVVTLGLDIEGDLTPETLQLPAELRRLRWKGCWLASHVGTKRLLIADLVFHGCDFRGTGFQGVDFRNVTFRDCNLEGTLFNRCRFEDTSFVETELEADARLAAMIIRKSEVIARVGGAGLAFHGEGVTARVQGCRFDFLGTGGVLELERASSQQLAISVDPRQGGHDADDRLTVRLTGGSRGSQLLVEGAIDLKVDGDSRVDQSIARPSLGDDRSKPIRPSITLVDDRSTIGIVQNPSSDA